MTALARSTSKVQIHRITETLRESMAEGLCIAEAICIASNQYKSTIRCDAKGNIFVKGGMFGKVHVCNLDDILSH